jgi:hypothetical protein
MKGHQRAGNRFLQHCQIIKWSILLQLDVFKMVALHYPFFPSFNAHLKTVMEHQ